MGGERKRSKKNAGQGKVWPDSAVDELLSYLNSQVAYQDPVTETRRKRVLDDVNQELAQRVNQLRNEGEDSSKQLSDYSAKQVRTKLSSLYASHKRPEIIGDDWTIIYSQGFACLD